MKTLGVVMDPIGSIKPYKDTTLALMLAAQEAGWALRYFEQADLWLRDGVAWGRARPVQVFDDKKHWFELGEPQALKLGELDAILMRKDPPFDLEYVASTYILERAEAQGALVVNKPQSLRDCNEKAYTAWFPQCTPPTLFSRDAARLPRRAPRRHLQADGRDGRQRHLPRRRRRPQPRLGDRAAQRQRPPHHRRPALPAGDQVRRQAHPGGRRRAGGILPGAHSAGRRNPRQPRRRRPRRSAAAERARPLDRRPGRSRAETARPAVRRARRDRRLFDRNQRHQPDLRAGDRRGAKHGHRQPPGAGAGKPPGTRVRPERPACRMPAGPSAQGPPPAPCLARFCGQGSGKTAVGKPRIRAIFTAAAGLSGAPRARILAAWPMKAI